ncbi:exodeoxyribonuclease VII large subunit [Megalodesulfovibrio gigas]|uniref:Exodeoxyribonuclease 7 large subunit n=1 Tax=Megalodesulfovibrio gigas (strain ATCC 19364 / DSM 1382 / NCIMB 9332 / VKM B-1759) TaxID=1121448 RepID=T2GF25_MEGG1|nr:exodeoxyribonuclease VII large subunit [Megalodesulfovibrio gigas]AGW14527.1 putative exodeoxyribonuclease 7 large subunit [Megalodesulfovibrio gigas DSM 1382 = ATCC 19364]
MKVFSVRELTTSLTVLLEREFPFCWVRGQVTNLSRPSSGHVYFSLKDEEAALSVVWFKHAQRRNEGGVDPLTGEWKEASGQDLARILEAGMEVICGGGLTIYGPRGQYQLVAEFVEDVGLGRLHLEFEALKRRFAGLGWFAQERKRTLPTDPARVAVITSPSGAALQDFLRLAQTRGTGAHLRVHPVLVQGDQAAGQIAQAIKDANADGWAQVVVLIRGGGSLEDLWAFNTEAVAEAVFQSAVPVLAGIGHEVDTTLADMIADVRAATPSHAAQLLWPERRDLAQGVDLLDVALQRAMARMLDHAAREFGALEKQLSLLSPVQRLRSREQDLEALAARLEPAVLRRLEAAGLAVNTGAERLGRAGEGVFTRQEQTLVRLEQALGHLDPHAPLARGYSLATVGRTGRFLRSIGDVQPGDALTVLVADGTVQAIVETVDPVKSAESAQGASS